MNSKDGLLIVLLLFLVGLLSYTLYTVVDDNKGVFQTKADEKNFPLERENKDEETLGVQTLSDETVYPSLDICYESNCLHIGPETTEIFYIDNELDSFTLYMYLLEKVVPYFEQLSGERYLVKNSNGSFYTWKEDLIIDTSNIYKGVEGLLENIEEEDLQLTYSLYKKDLPGTDGKYADKYIEIDNSKQKLYDWEDGKVVKEIDLSAAKRGFEVYGVFPIVDKGIEPRAPSLRYMPYWMAFYYSPWQKSWYGLHALVWWYDNNGNIVYENTDYIGVRRSGGCIRMLLDDAKYLYDRYDRGNHILIHE